jgi:hypothetical protein
MNKKKTVQTKADVRKVFIKAVSAIFFVMVRRRASATMKKRGP